MKNENNDLDFSILDALAEKRSFTIHTEARKGGIKPHEGDAEYKTMSDSQKTSQMQPDAPQAMYSKLVAEQRAKEAQQDAAEHQREVYRVHQEAIRRSGGIMTEITKGIINGVDPARLLLMACEVISTMTGDRLFIEQNRKNLIAVHGAGLLQPVPLEMELQEVQERLERLMRPELDNEPPDSLRRIEVAVKAHRERVATLEALIQKMAKSIRDT